MIGVVTDDLTSCSTEEHDDEENDRDRDDYCDHRGNRFHTNTC